MTFLLFRSSLSVTFTFHFICLSRNNSFCFENLLPTLYGPRKMHFSLSISFRWINCAPLLSLAHELNKNGPLSPFAMDLVFGIQLLQWNGRIYRKHKLPFDSINSTLIWPSIMLRNWCLVIVCVVACLSKSSNCQSQCNSINPNRVTLSSTDVDDLHDFWLNSATFLSFSVRYSSIFVDVIENEMEEQEAADSAGGKRQTVFNIDSKMK